MPSKIGQSDGLGEGGLVEAINTAWSEVGTNPDLAIYKLQSSAYKYSWLLIPLSLPFVWLLFPFNRRFHIYDHTVFVTYSLSFMLLLFALASMLSLSSRVHNAVPSAVVAYAPFHMYRQLRGTYGLKKATAWWKTWFLATFAFTALMLFAAAIAMLAIG